MSGLPKPKYRWRRSWPNVAHIFSGFDGERKIARIERHHSGQFWAWYMNFNHGLPNTSRLAPLSGTEPTAREAACAVEACYESVLAGTWYGMLPGDLEALLDHERYYLERSRPWEEEEKNER